MAKEKSDLGSFMAQNSMLIVVAKNIDAKILEFMKSLITITNYDIKGAFCQFKSLDLEDGIYKNCLEIQDLIHTMRIQEKPFLQNPLNNERRISTKFSLEFIKQVFHDLIMKFKELKEKFLKNDQK